MRTAFLVAVATLMVTPAAFAQSASPSSAPASGTPAPQSPTQGRTPIGPQIRKNLQSAGFTNIQIMPSSFLVRAKDQMAIPS